MNTFWDSIVKFFNNLGHTCISYIIEALPEAKQLALEAISDIIDEVVAYIEAKYAPDLASLKISNPLNLEKKLELDDKRRREAFLLIVDKIAAKGLTANRSLIYTQIELSVQMLKTKQDGNHGNFPWGNSNA